MTARASLPNRRPAESFDLVHNGQRYRATIGRDAAGQLVEIFLSRVQSSTDLDDLARDAGILASIALQHGVAAETLRASLGRDDRGQPCGPLLAALDLALENRP